MWVEITSSSHTGGDLMKCPAYLCAESDICLLPKYHKLIAEIKKEEEEE